MAREVVEDAAGRDDVDEAEQRGAQLGVLRGEVHGLVVELLDGVARGGRERRGEVLAGGEDLGFGRGGRRHGVTVAWRHADCRRGRRAHRRRRPGGRGAARARARAARCTARWPTASARTGPGARRRPRATSPRAARSRASSAAGRARARRSRPTRCPGCAPRCAPTRSTAAGAREWNDANVLALSLRVDQRGAAGGDPRRVVRHRPERRPRRRRERRAPRRDPVIALNARAAARPELGGVERWARELRARCRAATALGAAGRRCQPPRRARVGAGALPLLARGASTLLVNPANLAPVAVPAQRRGHPRRGGAARARVVLAAVRALAADGAAARGAAGAAGGDGERRSRGASWRSCWASEAVVVPGGVDARFVAARRRRRPCAIALRADGGVPDCSEEPGALEVAARRLAGEGIELVAAGGDRPQFRDVAGSSVGALSGARRRRGPARAVRGRAGVRAALAARGLRAHGAGGDGVRHARGGRARRRAARDLRRRGALRRPARPGGHRRRDRGRDRRRAPARGRPAAAPRSSPGSAPSASSKRRGGRSCSLSEHESRFSSSGRREAHDAVVLDLDDLAALEQQVDVAEHLGERQVGLGHRDVAPHAAARCS